MITGTPGTGKTSLCKHIVRRGRGWVHLDLGKFAIAENAVIEHDSYLKTDVVNTVVLKKALHAYILRSIEKNVKLLIDGHYAAEVTPSQYVNYCLVLRCRPDVLWQRLRIIKGYDEEKAKINVESEITDYCYLMARHHLKKKRVVQLDTTKTSVSETYTRFMKCYRNGFKCEGDRIDWINFILRNPKKMDFLFH